MSSGKPYYQDDYVTIYHGDCLDLMAQWREARLYESHVDAIITDPPWPGFDRLGMSEAEASGLLALACEYFPGIARRLVLVFRHDVDPRYLVAVPKELPFFRVQVLPYVMPGYIGRKLGGDELAYPFGEPIPSGPGRRVIPGYAPKEQPAGRKDSGHPCSRALGHFKWLVSWWTLEGETVLDPFMGSGTTIVAAREIGRKAIGIEIEKKYCEIAADRCRQMVFDLST